METKKLEEKFQVNKEEDIEKVMWVVNLALSEVRKDILRIMEVDKQFIGRYLWI